MKECVQSLNRYGWKWLYLFCGLDLCYAQDQAARETAPEGLYLYMTDQAVVVDVPLLASLFECEAYVSVIVYLAKLPWPAGAITALCLRLVKTHHIITKAEASILNLTVISTISMLPNQMPTALSSTVPLLHINSWMDIEHRLRIGAIKLSKWLSSLVQWYTCAHRKRNDFFRVGLNSCSGISVLVGNVFCRNPNLTW